MAKSAIAIAAHPDDIEFLMAGTLIRLRDAGFEIHYMNLADGRCGSTEFDAETTAKLRRAEAMRAAQTIGAEFHESICFDLSIFYDRETLAKVASTIREVNPRIVLTHAPFDYMEDHTNTCRLAVTAAFTRGMPNFPVDPPREAVSEQVVVYHAQPYSNLDPLRQVVEPDLFVDVSDIVEAKVEMLSCHVTQKKWLDESQGLDSYLQTLRNLDRAVGKMSGEFEYAEGWRRRLHLGFSTHDEDPLANALVGQISCRTHHVE